MAFVRVDSAPPHTHTHPVDQLMWDVCEPTPSNCCQEMMRPRGQRGTKEAKGRRRDKAPVSWRKECDLLFPRHQGPGSSGEDWQHRRPSCGDTVEGVRLCLHAAEKLESPLEGDFYRTPKIKCSWLMLIDAKTRRGLALVLALSSHSRRKTYQWRRLKE